MKPRVRWAILASALAVTLYLVWKAPDPESEAVIGETSTGFAAAAGLTVVSGVESPRLLALLPRNKPGPVRTLFPVTSWAPPRVIAEPRPVVAAAPTAPPVPFRFLGKRKDGGEWEVYASSGSSTLVLRQGEVIEGNYRVDSITPPTLKLTYLPLQQQQSLTIGAAE